VRFHRIGLTATLASALVLGGSLPCAAAGPDRDREMQAEGPGVPDLGSAKKFYAEGRKKYRVRNYAGALEDFQQAEEFKATPQAERYIGGCLDALGKYQDALEWYQRFLSHVPPRWGSQGTAIRQRVAEIKLLPGKVHIESNPPGALVSVDGHDRAVSTPAVVDLPPGPHKIKLSQTGRSTAEKAIDVAFASSQDVTLRLDELAPPPEQNADPGAAAAAAVPGAGEETPAATPNDVNTPPAAQGGGRNKRVPAYLTAGVGVLAAGTGAAFGVVALNDKKLYDANKTPENATRRDQDALISDVAFGVAVVAGVASLVLFLTAKDDPPPPSADGEPAPKQGQVDRRGAPRALAITPVPWVGSHEAGAGFVMQF
jgi:tetratricopeptide (TPR) repeat protein